MSSKANVNGAKQAAIRYYRSGNLRDALNAALIAVEGDPSDTAIKNLAGAIAGEIGDHATALKHLTASSQINPAQPNVHYLLGNSCYALKMNEQAVAAFNESLKLAPGQPDALVNLGLVLNSMTKFAEAERSLRRALEIAPDHEQGNHALARLLCDKSQPDKAENYAQKALSANPGKVEYITTLGKVMRMNRDFASAEKLYSVALSSRPNNPTLLCELGSVLREQNRFDAADEHYERALELAPKSTKVLRTTADYYRSMRNHEKAVEVYDRLFAIIGEEDLGALNNAAMSLRDLDRFDEAAAMYQKCCDLDKNNAYGFNNLAILKMEMGEAEDSIDLYRQAVEIDPRYKGARSNMLFYMNYVDKFSAKDLFETHMQWAPYHSAIKVDGSDYFANDLDPERKLRIGYISADFYGHAVSYFIQAALEFHDKGKFHVTCYAHVSTPDVITERLQGFADKFRYIHQLKDHEVVDLIQSDEIDILVELSGHTAGNRLTAVSMRPAPIQVTWIGYPNTTGVAEVDYRFVDEITDPPGLADETHSEKLWRLPRSFTCYTPSSNAPVADAPPAVENGYITFASCNNAAKLSDQSIKVWADVLKAVPNSKLSLKSASFVDQGTQRRFADRFQAHGIPEDRLEMRGRIASNHMLYFNDVDIGLDPFPYNGTTTSCETLWMGVPIITLTGERHASRVTASLLHQVGLGDLAADSTEDYVRIATELANDLERLKDIKTTLRETMRVSPLCDGTAHTEEVERAFREMWRIWCTDAPKREEERAAKGWPVDAPNKPHVSVINGLGNHYLVQLLKAVSVMDGLYLFTDIHPLGMQVFNPITQADKWHGLFNEDELKVISERKSNFKESMAAISNKIAEREGTLVVHPWNHLDYVAAPFLASPSMELDTSKALRDMFTLHEAFVVRHPMGQWHDYLTSTVVGDHVSVSEFLKGYRAMAEAAANDSILHIEDLSDDPDEFLRRLCDAIGIAFDPQYAEKWFMCSSVTGDPLNQTLTNKMFKDFDSPKSARLSPDVVSEIRGSADYHAILALLGYEDDYPVEGDVETPSVHALAEDTGSSSGITELQPPHFED